MTLVKGKPFNPPVHELGWLVPRENCTQLGFEIATRALKDVGILEVPQASNRGIRIDRMAKAAGIPLGSWWCALWAGRVLIDCGCLVPEEYPATDAWLPYVIRGGDPHVGDVVLYGLKQRGPVVEWGNAHHCGIIVRVPEPGQPLTLTIEGNRAYAGTTSNNGLAVDMGPMLRTDILGYFRPARS